MIVFLSIRPLYVQRIVSRDKRYEFRKSRFRMAPEIGVVYATAPVKKVVGYFEIVRIVYDEPAALWSRCKQYAGISQRDFVKYFSGHTEGAALEIGTIYEFANPVDPMDVIPGFTVPQSYRYIEPCLFQRLLDSGKARKGGVMERASL